jgi:hypothetical protein
MPQPKIRGSDKRFRDAFEGVGILKELIGILDNVKQILPSPPPQRIDALHG